MGLAALWHVGSPQTKDWTSVPCITRQILNHWTTRETSASRLFWTFCFPNHIVWKWQWCWKLKSLSYVQLFVTTWTVACQAPLSRRDFSRQEYWCRLPYPPPGDLPNPGIKPTPPALQADSLPSESPGKPKKTGVGSLSLLQGIFLTQESNPGPPHCRQILYHLNHQGMYVSCVKN